MSKIVPAKRDQGAPHKPQTLRFKPGQSANPGSRSTNFVIARKGGKSK